MSPVFFIILYYVYDFIINVYIGHPWGNSLSWNGFWKDRLIKMKLEVLEG